MTSSVVITVSIDPRSEPGMTVADWTRIEEWLTSHFHARFGLSVTSVRATIVATDVEALSP